jgi:hypothetical protein
MLAVSRRCVSVLQIGAVTMDPDSDGDVKLQYADGSITGFVRVSRLFAPPDAVIAAGVGVSAGAGIAKAATLNAKAATLNAKAAGLGEMVSQAGHRIDYQCSTSATTESPGFVYPTRVTKPCVRNR